MFVVPMNSNSVYISMVPTGCLKAEFDSTYPIHLNGIIRQDEFQQSINNINRAFSSYRNFIIACWITFAITLTAGTLCFAFIGLVVTKSLAAFYVLLALGIILSTFGSVFLSVGFCIAFSKRAKKLREAVAQESAKYSSRSPVQCSWRLDSSRTWIGYGNNNNQVLYQLVIDIGHSGASMNSQVVPQSVSFGNENQYSPPPYFTQSTGFCAKCNAPIQDLSARFCSSCGHSIKK